MALAACLLSAPASAQAFERLHASSPSHVALIGLAAVDLDGDEDLDLVGVDAAPLGSGSGLVALENDGSGRFARRVLASGSFSTSPQLSVGAFAGGEGPDVLVQTATDIRLFVNQGGLVLVEQSAGTPPASGYHEHAAGDVDGDGDDDLYLTRGNFPGPAGALYRNDGSGTFTATVGSIPSLDAARARFLDAEGDGDLDLIVVGGARELLRNDGTGTFVVDGTAVLPPLLSPTELEVQDIDLDGLPDLRWNSSWALNTGSGSFGATSTFVPEVRSFRFLDWNGAGAQDCIALPRYDALALSIGMRAYAGTGPGQLAPASAPVLEQIESQIAGFVSGDFDGDGDEDLFADALGSGLGGAVAARDLVLWNRGEGAMEIALTSPEGPVQDFRASVQVADGNGDGALDGFVLRRDVFGIDRLAFVENDGTGLFADPAPFGSGIAFRVLDLEGDGDPDVASITSTPTRPLGLWSNDGAGGFALGTPAVPPFTYPTAPLEADLQVGDLNGDGRLDLLVCADVTGGNLPTHVLLNDGTGALHDAPTSVRDQASKSRLADLDGDGDLDAVTFEKLGGLRTYLNAGDGDLTWSGKQINAPVNHLDMALADVDGLGGLELCVLRLGELWIHTGDGSGGFTATPATRLVPATSPPSSEAFLLSLDGDDDGLPDFYLNTGIYWRNTGGLTFVEATQDLPEAGDRADLTAAAAGDLDRDGDVDLWLGGETQIDWNLRRQLAWRSWPRVGKPLTLDLYGSPDARYLLSAGFVSAAPLTSGGAFPVSLAPTLRLPQGFLDAEGRASVTWNVPNDPSLAGTTLLFRAVIGSPLRPSNIETVVLHGS